MTRNKIDDFPTFKEYNNILNKEHMFRNKIFRIILYKIDKFISKLNGSGRIF